MAGHLASSCLCDIFTQLLPHDAWPKHQRNAPERLQLESGSVGWNVDKVAALKRDTHHFSRWRRKSYLFVGRFGSFNVCAMLRSPEQRSLSSVPSRRGFFSLSSLVLQFLLFALPDCIPVTRHPSSFSVHRPLLISLPPWPHCSHSNMSVSVFISPSNPSLSLSLLQVHVIVLMIST